MNFPGIWGRIPVMLMPLGPTGRRAAASCRKSLAEEHPPFSVRKVDMIPYTQRIAVR